MSMARKDRSHSSRSTYALSCQISTRQSSELSTTVPNVTTVDSTSGVARGENKADAATEAGSTGHL
jgi:hypothetical protein